jgi:hypothetical protein
MMPKQGIRGRSGPGLALAGAAAVGLLLACSERERLTFPEPGDGIGPRTFIDRPEQDTVVRSGPGLAVRGRTVDQDGVDSVYFYLIGGSESFSPFKNSDESDTVRFELPVSTNINANDTLFVLIYGTDLMGNVGDTAIRRLIIRP